MAGKIEFENQSYIQNTPKVFTISHINGTQWK